MRGSYGVRAKDYGPNPAGARAALTAQTRRVQAVGHAHAGGSVWLVRNTGRTPQNGADPEARRVQAVGHVRRRQCVAARTEYGHPGRHGIRSAAGNGVQKHAQEKPDGEPTHP